MKLKNVIILVLIMVTLFSTTQIFSAPQKEVETIKVGAILAVTGGASFLGAPESKTLEMLVEQINNKGGVNGKKIELIIKDSQANPENAISFAKQLIEEDKVIAIIGPSTSGESLKIKDICEENQTILLSCAAAEAIVDPVASYVFKTPQKDSYAAMKIFETMNKMGISKIGIVVGNTGFGNGGKAQLEKYAPDYGITIVISEVYESSATDLTSVLTKLNNAGIEAVVNWSIVPAQSIIPKNMKQLGMKQPLFQSHGFGNIKYVEAAGDAAEGIIFPCGRLLVADVLPDSHPQKALLVSYKTSYESKFNEDASTFGGHAYDALIILEEAIKKAKSTDKAKVRAAIETLTGVVGTGGIFNFSATDHNGLDINSFEMLTVENGKFVVFSQ
ncbi:MAG: ABC transporter substrate-binding protein [Spirochaetales bacterium]|nr:ABC transporter substrate-binding protein [Spirochaetales bacterium]